MTTTTARELLDHTNPLLVTGQSGRNDQGPRTRLLIGYVEDKALPTSMAVFGTRVLDKVGCRIGGGCKGLDPDMRWGLVDYSLQAFDVPDEHKCGGLYFGGATRERDDDGNLSPMVTDISVALHRQSKAAGHRSILLGTFPRVGGYFHLVEQSRLVVGAYDTEPNPAYDIVYIEQEGMEGTNDDSQFGWHADLVRAGRLVESWLVDGGFRAFPWLLVNGGDATKKEFELALRLQALGLPVPIIMLQGWGRFVDEALADLRAGRLDVPENAQILIAERDDPMTLREHLYATSLLRRPAA